MPTPQYGFPTLEERRAAQLEKEQADRQKSAQKEREKKLSEDRKAQRYRVLSPLVHSVLQEYAESYGVFEDLVREGTLSDPTGSGNLLQGWMFDRLKEPVPSELSSLHFLLFGENSIYMLCSLPRAESDRQYRRELSHLRDILSRKTDCNVRIWIFNYQLKTFRETYIL